MIAFSQLREAFCTRPAGFTEALMVAVAAHQGQKNKFTGEDYILHVLRVIERVPRVGIEFEDHELMSVAALHDVLEDTSITADGLLQIGFSFNVVDGVLSVPRQESESTYQQFINRAATHPLGRHVKVADLLDHLDRPEPRPGMHSKYERALLYLRRNNY